VRDATAHFITEWCNERVGIWSCGHSHNSVMNTNVLEATNKVIKDELTFRQLMPVLDFLRRALLWLREQSERRDPGHEGARNPNAQKFALEHDFITLDWTEAYAWRMKAQRQIFFLPEQNIFVAAAPGARGDLTEIKALAFDNAFTSCSLATYDEYTSITPIFLSCDMIPPDLSYIIARALTMPRSLPVSIRLESQLCEEHWWLKERPKSSS
jgi:hypothetical protein